MLTVQKLLSFLSLVYIPPQKTETGGCKMSDHESKEDAPVRVLSGHRSIYNREDIKYGSLEFIGEQAGNGAETTYQEATGAPIEARNPLGYEVSTATIIFLNFGQMIGTGVFSTRM